MRPLVFIWGTRPEAIKISKVVEGLRGLGIEPHLICTGQHTTLLKGTPAETTLEGSTLLGLPGQPDPMQWVKEAVPVLKRAIRQYPNPIVCVQGDTASAFAGALAAHELRTQADGRWDKHPCQIAHIEAGVRSGNSAEPYPEEEFRIRIDEISDFHFCPTAENKLNLHKELGVLVSDKQSVEQFGFVTGNPGVSALWGMRPKYYPEGDGTILVTLHRRELLADPAFPEIVKQIAIEAGKGPFTVRWPMHPSARVILEDGYRRQWQVRAKHHRQFRIMKPLPYRRMVKALSQCSGVLTDSGGLVEDAVTLGIPCCILRTHHDRPEAVQFGSAIQVGRSVGGVKSAFQLFRSHWPRTPNPVFGTVDSAQRIAEILASL